MNNTTVGWIAVIATWAGVALGCGGAPQDLPDGEPVGAIQAADSTDSGAGTCSSVSLNADSPLSPSASGTPVTLSAQATCSGQGTAQYEFWLLPQGGSWSPVCSWQDSSTCTWANPTAGTYEIQVWSRSSGSSAGYDSYTPVETHVVSDGSCPTVSLNADAPLSPSAAGTSVTLSATAACSGAGTAQYEFWLLPQGGSWSPVCPWQDSSTCTWANPTAGSYEVQAWSRSTSSSAAYDGYSQVETHVVGGGGTCSSVSLNADSPLSPSANFMSVTLSATASCSGEGTAQYEFWLLPEGGSWSPVCPWQDGSTCTWANPTSGTYQIQVWSRSSGSGASYDSYSSVETHVVSSGTCSTVSLNADSPLSPSAPGTSVTFSATATCVGPGTAQYEFWLLPQGGSWSAVCPWQDGSTCTWANPTAGTYEIQVWSKSTSSGAPYDGYSSVETHVVGGGGTCSTVSLNDDSPSSPSPSGTSVTLSATATCSGEGTAQYEFWLLPEGGSWSPVCPWQGSSTCTWANPTAGSYQIQVWSKSSGSGASYDSYTPVETHVISDGTCSSVSLNADSPVSPSAAGTSVTLSATAACSGAGTAQYEFWLLPQGGSWSAVCPWQGSSTCTWANPTAGSYQIQVWSKSSSSGATYDSFTSVETHVIQESGGGDDGGTEGGGPDGGVGNANLAAGNEHTCSRTTAGGLQCWGENDLGELGNNSTTESNVPVQVSGLSSGLAAVAAGNDHTCALTTAGSVECWGDNQFGQLGNNSTTESNVPVQVSGLSSGVVAISAGAWHTCALTSAGALECWGFNFYGQLGNDSTTQSNVPVAVTGLSSGVAAVSVGHTHTCAVMTSGAVQCWGANTSGQLGNNSTVESNVPVAVSGLSSGVAVVAAGGNYTCAVTTRGAVQCWGDNTWGELGNGSTTNSNVPVAVSGLTSGIAAVAAGYSNACSMTAGGAVQCWGDDTDGDLGNGSTSQSNVPAAVSGLSSGATAIAAGVYHTCALTGAGVQCWGDNSYGELGDNSTTNSDVPVGVE